MAIHELTGKVNEPVTMTVEKPADWFQTNDIYMEKNLGIALDQKSAYFTPSEDGIYAFECGTEQFIVTVGVGLPPKPEIPPIEIPPEGTTFIDISATLKGPKRTLTKHGQLDTINPRIEARAGDNRNITILEDGTIEISGDQVRVYFLYPNYNSEIEYDREFEGKGDTEDDGSDDLRSRHNEGEIAAEAFNKIGGEIVSEELGGKGKCKRENVHGTYVELKSYTAPKVKNAQVHHVKYSCRDDGPKKIRLIRTIDGNECLNTVDGGAPDTFFDKATIKRKSYFRIRNNGKGKTIVRNLKLTILPD